jgi:hypothetical protein
MSKDILEAWKKEKFILVPHDLLDKDETMVVLTDYMYWIGHDEELRDWCKQHNANIEGMCIVFPDPQTLTLFTLKWS